MRSYVRDPLVSIIIPIYNVENYLNQCLQSIINQTYKNLEIILVDDGSSDNSGKIADKWAKKDARIKVIHQKNKGLSAARNTGLNNYHGDWIAFVDSDDYVASNYIEKMLREGQKNGVQLVNCTYIKVDDKTGKVNIPQNNLISGIYTAKQFWVEYYNNHLPTTLITAWSKLYYKDIFKNIRYKEGIINEDEQIIYSVVKAANKVLVIKDSLYYYRINRKGSIKNKVKYIKIDQQYYAIFYNRINNLIKDGLYREAKICNEEILFGITNEYSLLPNNENKKIFVSELGKIKLIFQELKKYKLNPTKKAYLYIKLPFFICLLKRIKRKFVNK